jgi:hypothetical protein
MKSIIFTDAQLYLIKRALEVSVEIVESEHTRLSEIIDLIDGNDENNTETTECKNKHQCDRWAEDKKVD